MQIPFADMARVYGEFDLLDVLAAFCGVRRI